mmetsp:Transcript_7978/g.14053  ORF Transcript_7978/g.14053 Transcript_7978/m.14053 type:complete len:130 (+) Transcript_7978:225-614(+)
MVIELMVLALAKEDSMVRLKEQVMDRQKAWIWENWSRQYTQTIQSRSNTEYAEASKALATYAPVIKFHSELFDCILPEICHVCSGSLSLFVNLRLPSGQEASSLLYPVRLHSYSSPVLVSTSFTIAKSV